jgi:hypothetical protein
VTITNGYATVADFESFAGQNVLPARYAAVEEAIEVASRWVDDHTGREFFQTASSARYFDPFDTKLCWIDDAVSVSIVAVDTAEDGTYATTLAGSEYQLLPPGGGSSYTAVHAVTTTFPTCAIRYGVIKVTAVWGWATIPVDVKRATLTLAQDIFRDNEARVGGLTVDANAGVVLSGRVPPRVASVLNAFRRMDRVGGVG